MKNVFIGVLIGSLAVSGIQISRLTDANKTQGEELFLTKMANAATTKVSPIGTVDKVDVTSVLVANRTFGVDPYLLAAIRIEEDGRFGREMGYEGKIDFISLYYPAVQWQYIAAARLLNKINARWAALSEQERKHYHDYFDFCSQTYTGPPKEKHVQWAKTVRYITWMLKTNQGKYHVLGLRIKVETES